MKQVVLAALLFFLLQTPFVLAQDSEKSAQSSRLLLRIHGSNTIGEKFAPELIKGFLKQEGFFPLRNDLNEKKIERYIVSKNRLVDQILDVELFSHGSSTGFQDLLSSKTDIAMSSRPIKSIEIKDLSNIYPSLSNRSTEHVIAYDALAIIVNQKNVRNKITIHQLADIYSGKIKNWKTLGGKDLAIKVLSRDNNSGTYDTFKNLVLKKYDSELSANSKRFESSIALAEEVNDTEGAIGFIGISHVGKAKVLAIAKNENEQGVLPDDHTVGTEFYPLSRKLYLYVPIEIKNPIARKFVDFALSNQGQSLAKKASLISFFPTKSRPYANHGKLRNEYKNLRMLGQRLSITFRLENSQLDVKSERDLKRIISYHKFNPYQKIVLAGFWNDPSISRQSEIQIQNWLDLLKGKLTSQDLVPWSIYAGYLPVDNNPNTQGSVVDRRIEVWVL